MLTITIPGRNPLKLEHLVLDYNGTIAVDGRLIEGLAERLEELSESLDIYVVTADTHGNAAVQCRGLPARILTYPQADVGPIKAQLVRELKGAVVCIGNGFNDLSMSECADLSIAVIGTEGAYGPLLNVVDIVVCSIQDALDLLLKPRRLTAVLRS